MFGIVYGLWNVDRQIWSFTGWLALILMFTFPIINELFLTIKGKCCRSRVTSKTYLKSRMNYELGDRIPILYSKRYNMHFFGIEKAGGNFDAYKGKRVWDGLVKGGIIDEANFIVKKHEPTFPSREFI